jgi:hypothetical protein
MQEGVIGNITLSCVRPNGKLLLSGDAGRDLGLGIEILGANKHFGNDSGS